MNYIQKIYRILLKLLQPRKVTDKKDTTGKSVRKRVVICKFRIDYFFSICMYLYYVSLSTRPKDALILGNSKKCLDR